MIQFLTKRSFAGLACLTILLSTSTPAQPPAPPTADAPPTPSTFDIADVHTSAHTTNPYMRGGMLRGDRYNIRDATMVDLIATAYKVDPLNVIGGPSWLELDRFDISARAPRTTSQDTAALMLRALLADRFKLNVQTGTRPQPTYVLSAGKNPKLKQADGTGTQGCQFQPMQQTAKGAPQPNSAEITFACHNTTMEAFAQFLHQVARPTLPRPVIDSTSLPGAWDFDIHWTFQFMPGAPAGGTTIFEAVDKQLGLKLELKTSPLPVAIVTSVNQKPTPNPPGLAANLPPPPPAEFEVAVIRPHAPKEKHFGIQVRGGNISFQFASIETLIAFAWDIDKEMIVRGSSVLTEDQDFFDITGKASSNAPPGPGGGPAIDIDDLREMTRSLLADRFKLKVHTEARPYDALTLLAGTPKMKKADPANRASCKPGPGPDGKDPRVTNPALTRLVSCQNMTMAQLAAEFRTLAPGNIKTPVLDQTGLQGGYDFTLYWSGENDGPTPQPASGDASDPGTGIPLAEAVSKQLGLKLEKQKRPVEMLVIDHIEEKPTDN
jgi:uncharacterized protein (TIGR03435 family)